MASFLLAHSYELEIKNFSPVKLLKKNLDNINNQVATISKHTKILKRSDVTRADNVHTHDRYCRRLVPKAFRYFEFPVHSH